MAYKYRFELERDIDAFEQVVPQFNILLGLQGSAQSLANAQHIISEVTRLSIAMFGPDSEEVAYVRRVTSKWSAEQIATLPAGDRLSALRDPISEIHEWAVSKRARLLSYRSRFPVPQVLQDWTISFIEELLARNAHEPDTFDFKEKLPDRRDAAKKRDLSIDIAAFANSPAGGFLVYGIADNRSASPESRIVGIEAVADFYRHFGEFVSKANPPIGIVPLNPPIALRDGKVIHIIHIPRSWKAPHAVGDADSLVFPRRTHKGNEWMSYPAIQEMFLSHYEKRSNLELLKIELRGLAAHARGVILTAESFQTTPSATLHMFLNDTFLIDTVVANNYSIIAPRTDLVASLMIIRSECRALATAFRQMQSRELAAPSNLLDLIGRHHDFCVPHATQLIRHADRALAAIDELTA